VPGVPPVSDVRQADDSEREKGNGTLLDAGGFGASVTYE
jgi:hypothetical protein